MSSFVARDLSPTLVEVVDANGQPLAEITQESDGLWHIVIHKNWILGRGYDFSPKETKEAALAEIEAVYSERA